MIYDFLDELAADGVINLQRAVRPYYRDEVAGWLREAEAKDSLLSREQRREVAFYSQEFALELDTMPDYTFYGIENKAQWRHLRDREKEKCFFNLSLVDPSLHMMTFDKKFKMVVKPILGMDIEANAKGLITKRWFGAELQMDIANHFSIWGSLRDISWDSKGDDLRKHPYYGGRLVMPDYLTNRPGVQYKESNTRPGDFSDSRGGMSLYTWWGAIGLQRESVQWGTAYHCSNILSGRNPAIPMLTLQLTPCRWFQFDYFHAWLVSNVLDSTDYYLEQNTIGQLEKEYRPRSKYMAANMFTFMPVKQLSFSFGNSIIYAERNVQAAYFIPVAFYKSLDHLLTKGISSENQNSQVFASLSLCPTDHLLLYGSFFLDEFSVTRLKKNNPQHNPLSYLVGFNWSGWPVRGLSLKGEFMRSYIASYTHSIKVLTYTSNSYNLGHYMGDNSQSIHAELAYHPVRGLRLVLDYTQDTKYNAYRYLRDGYANGHRQREGGIGETLSQKPFADRTWINDCLAFHATYEVFQNCYAHIDLAYNNARAKEASASHYCTNQHREVDEPLLSEWRGDYLNRYTPYFYQGKNLTFTCGLSFNF